MTAPRILIVRLSAFGDCVLTLPMLCELRRLLPHAHIAWLTQSNCAPVIQGHPCLDEVIETPRGYLRSAREVSRLRNELRRRSFDVTIDPQSLLKSSIAAWFSGAPKRIGLSRPLGREGSTWLNNRRITPKATHIIERQKELLIPLGFNYSQLGGERDRVQSDVEFQVPVDAEAEQMISAWRRAQGLDAFLVFNPGAAWPSKCWPLNRYAEAAKNIMNSHGIPIVIAWGGKKEQTWAGELVEMAAGAAVMAPKTNLRELASLLRQAELAVGSDTGPLHLAEAVGIPCVGIYGPTRAEQSGPYGDHHVLLQKRYHEGTSRERRTAGNEAICLISSEELTSACQDILNRDRPLPSAAPDIASQAEKKIA